MGKQIFVNKIIIILFLLLLPVFSAKAFDFSFPSFPDIPKFPKEHLLRVLEKICLVRAKINQKHSYFSIPRICKTKNIKPPTLEFYAEPQSITEGESTTLSWASDNTLSCEASGGWSGEKTLSGEEIVFPLMTTTYALSCDGVEDGIEKSIEVIVVPPLSPIDVCPNLPDNQATIPAGYHDENGQCVADQLPPADVCPNIEGVQETVPAGYHKEGDSCIEDAIPNPTLDHIIISEVYYDVDDVHGAESSNEWIELYNGTGSPVDLSGWGVYDGGASGSDSIPAGTIISSDSFLLITGSSTTASKWPDKTFVVLRSIIGGGLANGGDAVLIKDLASSTVDAMSYGSNTSIFTLPVPSPSDGHSFRRINLTTDTNTASDWEDLVMPTPGSF